ncbi:MAG: transcription antitermination factor NusB [Clostridia bacterium]|nr:transcription antitermination factor NusB [Clostridia bacterium]
MNRTKAREYAFILLFQYKFQPAEIGQILDDFCKEYNPKDQEGYIRSVVLNATENIEQIDKIIAEKSEGWGVERLSSVNLSVLRLSVTEMLYLPDVPRVVSVNEAVGLAKTYDGEESVDFVNGVLDKIKNSL